jgi:3-hydroxybutyryl-CoA dehydrogenase
VNKGEYEDEYVSALPTEKLVAVVGAGAMGAGIAQVAAAAGHRVRLLDARPGAAERAVADLQATFDKLAAKGKLSAEAADAAKARLLPATTLDDLADAGLVIEAIIEDLGAKQKLFSDLEAIVDADCIFATNTSSISVTAIGAALKNPGRLAGLHFFNPAPLMALVEVISGLATDPALADTLYATAEAWGKKPVLARSTPGFIVNRVARPYYGEGLRLLNEGAADCATLDAIFREAGGFRMGPFELMDMIGLDVNFAVTQSVWNAFFNDPRFTPSLIQRELVSAGFLGRKSGRGFYPHGENAATPQAQSIAAQPAPADIRLFGDSALARALAERLKAHNIAHEHVDALHDDVAGLIATAGGTSLYITDGRSASQCAAESGFANIVLVDLAFDYASATRLAVAAAEQCDPAAFNAAAGLLQAAGFAVSQLADVPGMAVMRTVCMLANEGADAVYQNVCSAPAVDQAMRLGTNYPRGPLAWADAIGLPTVRCVLANLAENYGEDRYRISPLITRKVFSGKRFHEQA